MTPQRWSRIKEVFFRARETREEERSAYLASACGDDRELRAEVELLLAKDNGPSLRRPAADLLESIASQLVPGETVAQYRVEAKLGEGGMGAVYRAFDTQLRREVALKVLSGGRLADPESKQRLLREARASSALNHPNIVTVYEITSEGGVDFIAMEFVEGKSLHEIIPAKGLPLGKVLEYAVQIASGLAKAHAAGIIHRDLKPSNIMVTSDGVVKLMDFGLARRVRRAESETASLTQEGEIAGTPAYMSPEQARGEELDARGDLFSFGVVLYEMATGKQAFSGTTSALIFDAILHQAPVSPVRLNPKCPLELERIINKALEKDPDLRYQSASEMSADLKRMKRDTESERARAALHERRSAMAAALRRYRWRWIIALAAIAVVVTALEVARVLWLGGARPATLEPAFTAVPLTTYPGFEGEPSFSPDGNQVAFSWNGHIYIKLIGTSGPPLRLTTDPAADYSPGWSPDGRFIAFLRCLSPEQACLASAAGRAAFLLIPALGGPERKLTEILVTPFVSGPYLAWSSDGNRLIISSRDSPKEPAALFLLSIESGEKRRLTSPPANLPGDGSPALSLDGRTLAFSRSADEGIDDLYLLSLSADLQPVGEARRLTRGNWSLGNAAWTPDGREIVFSGRRGQQDGLWRIDPIRSDEPQRLAPLADNIGQPAISPRGHRLAYAHRFYHSSIWRMAAPESLGPGALKSRKPASSAKQFISSTRYDWYPQYSPDGKRIAFASTRSGNQELWISDGEGSNAVQLTSLGGVTTPRWSPDGGRIAFDSNAAGNFDIWVVSANGGKPQRMTTDPANDGNPSWSRNGRWIYFDSARAGEQQVFKMPASGGEAIQVTRDGGFAPFESRDGKFLYYTKYLWNTSLWRIRLEGGQPTKVLDSVSFYGNLAIVDGGLYFVPGIQGVSRSIQFLSFATNKTIPVASSDKPIPVGLDVSPDGKWILYNQTEQTASELMLVENFH